MSNYVFTFRPRSSLPGPQKPSGETGVYLRSHKHTWRRLGSRMWPSGDVCPTFECSCGSIICDLSVDLREEAPNG